MDVVDQLLLSQMIWRAKVIGQRSKSTLAYFLDIRSHLGNYRGKIPMLGFGYVRQPVSCERDDRHTDRRNDFKR